ncbi:MAG: LLM class flavin-dependent oxidoreductase [Pseudomonadota bacterium]|nr:LLM class flavin-dependent oxidoreductase [Pseudomonadota bacterium]
MKINLPGRDIKVFTVMPRTRDRAAYVQNLTNLACWSEARGSTGVLMFLGNDTLLDPWLSACAVMTRTRDIQPLVAVNPIYMHPFSAARMISSLALLFERRIHVNLIAGTAVRDLTALGDRLEHDLRYERLREYAQVMRLLLTQRRPVSFQGCYYQIDDLQLLPAVPPDLQPSFLLAGQSATARAIARSISAETLRMLGPELEGPTDSGEGGVYFGIVTRPDRVAAVQAAHAHFPTDDSGREIARRAMQATDATWKRRLWSDNESEGITNRGYWLGPFKNFQADCPYVVGERAAMSDLIANLVRRGATTFVIDTPVIEIELEEIACAFKGARDLLHSELHH